MSQEIDSKVELALQELAKNVLRIRKDQNDLGEVLENALEKKDTEELKVGAEILRGLESLIEKYGHHADILVAYQNSRLTKELVKQNKRLTQFTGVLAMATILLFIATIVVPFLQ